MCNRWRHTWGGARVGAGAGAPCLALVGHLSPAAIAITTDTLERLQAKPGPARAEALHQTMLTLIDYGADPPTFWGPFSLMGEGQAAFGRGGTQDDKD